MRKYRLTKITVKTRRVISTSKHAQDSICPLCYQPLSVLIPAEQSSAVKPNTKKQTAELSPPKSADKMSD